MSHVEERLSKDLLANRVSLALEALDSLDGLLPLLERMPNLTELDLHGNKLTRLPKDMSGLRKLKALNIKHNAFPSVSIILPSLQSLPALRELHADATTDADEEDIIVGLSRMAVFNGTNLLGDDDVEIESPYIKLTKERSASFGNKDQLPKKTGGAENLGLPSQRKDLAPPPVDMAPPPKNTLVKPPESSRESGKATRGVGNDVAEAEFIFEELKSLRTSISRSENARLINLFEAHIRKTENELTSKQSDLHDPFQRKLEVSKAKHSLLDFCFQEAISFASTENPAFAVSLRKIRLGLHSTFEGAGNLVNAMHRHYTGRLTESNDNIGRAESENSMLLQAAEALEQEMLAKNEEIARLMTELEHAKMSHRIEQPQVPAAPRRQQPLAPPPPQASSGGSYAEQQSHRALQKKGLGPSMKTLPTSFRTGPPPPPGATPGGGAFGPSVGPTRSAEKARHDKIRVLSLKQLKENFIDLIYQSKLAFDKKCAANHLPRETMEQHMYTFLNQRYGLKSLIIEHASAVIKGINRYSDDDNDVAVFGKVLRNEIDEEFCLVQKQLKETVVELLRVYLKGKMPMKTDASINRILESRIKGDVEEAEWVDIIKYMYNHEDGLTLMVLVKDAIRELPVPPVRVKLKNNIPTRRRGSIMAMAAEAQSVARSGRIPYRIFLKILLDFQLKGHEKFLSRFRRLFRDVDADRNGILNEDEFRQFVLKIDPNKSLGEMDDLMNAVDPWNNENITFSEAVGVMAADLVSMMTKQRD